MLRWTNLTYWLAEPGDHAGLALLDELHDPTPAAPSLTLAKDLLHTASPATIDHQIYSLIAGGLAAQHFRIWAKAQRPT